MGPATCRFGARCFASQKGANASMKPCAIGRILALVYYLQSIQEK